MNGHDNKGCATRDLSLLSQGKNVTKTSTNKAIEIFHQVSSCLNCTCESSLNCVSLNLTRDTHEGNLLMVS